MTRSHHYWSQTIHIACSHGVTFKRVPPKSCPTEQSAKLSHCRKRGPQGLRRPRFSFFLFSCQTARGLRTPLPLLGATKTLHRTTNDNRTTAGCLFTHLDEELRGTKTCLGRRGQGSAALSEGVIGSRFVYCQRQSSTNCRIESPLWVPGKADLFAVSRRT